MLSSLCSAQPTPPTPRPLTLWYSKPAAKWSAEALPLGNGRLGCMVFGGVEKERVQFNDSSLWTGDENPSGNYDPMGAYQNFGDVFIEFTAPGTVAAAPTPPASPGVRAASDHKPFYESESIEQSIDGEVGTKWCVEHHGKPVIWELTLPAGAEKAVAAYTLTSTNEKRPDRDPRTWEFAGSDDGREWTVLDRRADQPAFDQRGKGRTFECDNKRAFRKYRLTFLQNQGGSHFQLAEIALGQRRARARRRRQQRRQHRQRHELPPRTRPRHRHSSRELRAGRREI